MGRWGEVTGGGSLSVEHPFQSWSARRCPCWGSLQSGLDLRKHSKR